MFASYPSIKVFLALSLSMLVIVSAHGPPRLKTCVVEPACDGSDDAPSVIQAFQECGKNGKVIFKNETYRINSVINTTGLENCEIDLRGTLLVLPTTPVAFNFADDISGVRTSSIG
jgi:galacturan 1,4-alpha-galacturonidase